MTQELTRKHGTLSGKTRSLVSSPPWHGLALAAVLILSAFLILYDLTSEGYSNNYYAAAVKNMLTSWHNFFFVSFDAGFVSVDKPPLGLWTQAASAYLFGFNGWVPLLPRAIAGERF
jgi:4-amino-4-deoxy-L-arabinose transferase-like glycosyltransferase